MKQQMLKPLMIAGTGSDVGKSILVAGLCRIFLQDGYHPAPFKAQNMALNSYVSPDGLELGRAQAVQAEAAGIDCSADMNPILLKPIGDCVSQVILNGKPIGNRSAKEYFKAEGRQKFAKEAHDAFDRLAQKYNPIVLEGAGSLAEINLMHLDIVNLPMAQYADASVFLVADISHGGVFASLYGSIMLLKPEFKRLIKGIIINKFRGDISLFEDGKRQLEELCGVPVIGVLPYLKDLQIEEEDSYFQKSTASSNKNKIKVAVIKLPHISNFTDFDPLEVDGRFDLFYTLDQNEILHSDLIIIPGTKSTISDLSGLYKNGVANAIVQAHSNGKAVVGICGGYQMIGQSIKDPECVEGSTVEIKGLGLLPITTTIGSQKITRRIKFKPWESDTECLGYEIHMGESVGHTAYMPFATLEDGKIDGCRVSGKCFGTYLHGLFENMPIVDSLCSTLSASSGQAVNYKAFKESQYDRLASEMRKHLDVDLIYKIIQNDD